MEEPKALCKSDIDFIAGKNSVGGATKEDVDDLIAHILFLEKALDKTNMDDYFGTEGWRHNFNCE